MPEAFDLDDTPSPDPQTGRPVVPVPPPPQPAAPATSSGATLDRPAPTQARPPAGQTQSAPNTKTTGVPPAAGNRASDLLRGHPNYKAAAERDTAPRTTTFLTADRRTTKFDDFATGVFWIALVVATGCLLYYLYGIFSGQLSHEAMKSLSTDAKQQILSNIEAANTVMTYSALVATATLVFLFYDESFASYSLVGFAVFLQVILPLIIQQFFAMSKMTDSDATKRIVFLTKETSIIPAIPGFCLLGLEVIRQLVSKFETAKVAKSNLKYGQGMTFKQPKIRNQFLGPCWNMPYCRDTIRSKCPIFIAKKGPCWRNKRGCMCDETIVLNATAGDWKNAVTSTLTMVEPKKGATVAPVTQVVPQQQQLSMAFKKERCRQCVIYNTHQEQKYKALVAITFIGTAALLGLLSQTLLGFVIAGYNMFDGLLAKMSFGGNTSPTSNALSAGIQLADPVAWVLLALVTIVVLSKFLQLVEYCCFKIKI